MYNTEASS